MSRERAEATAARIESEAVDAGFAALEATPRILTLDQITAAFALDLAVARKVRRMVTL